MEEIPRKVLVTPLDEQCENHFRSTHSRCPDGRYIVRLPFKEGPPIDIGETRHIAEKMLASLHRRFHKYPEQKPEYSDFLQTYETLGHMQEVSGSPHPSCQQVYLPHHPVLRESSATTHLRVVFNASSISTNGSSLNDHLLVGPKLQTEQPAVLLQWRQWKYVYTADIAKMYRQIQVDPRDLSYQRILWSRDPSDPPREYQLLTVTYGTASAPYLALRVLKQLVMDEGADFPLAVPVLKNNIYVDDVLFGGDSVSVLRQTREQLDALLKRGGFELRKWASNSSALLADIAAENHGLACSKSLQTDEKLKILGISWNPSLDMFQFQVTLSSRVPQTKRAVLSAIAKVFDPLGWATPVTVALKILMQELWRAKIGWDDALPPDLMRKWSHCYGKLSHLNGLRLSRWTRYALASARAELHGFCDASTVAYGAVVYVKVTSASGEVTVSLLAGKSKVAPITPMSVPRLELCATVLLARLMEFVSESLGLEPNPRYCWTDSTVVLAWLSRHPSTWKTFVANRVQKCSLEFLKFHGVTCPRARIQRIAPLVA